MAFGFKYTLPNISGSHAYFPVLLKEADFPTTSIDGGADSLANGGGDLAAYTSSAKTTRLPVEVVDFVTGVTPSVEVYVKIPIAATGNTIYIERDAVQTTQPAVTATYGRNAVWADYESVLHLVESGIGTSGEFVDSSGNGVTAKVENGTSSLVTTEMPWSGGWQYLGGTNDNIIIENSGNLLDNSDFTMQLIWRAVTLDASWNRGLLGNRTDDGNGNYTQVRLRNGACIWQNRDGVDYRNTMLANPGSTIHFSHFTQSNAALKGYKNGVLENENTVVVSDGLMATSNPIRIGAWFDLAGNEVLEMRGGRVRLRKSILSANWIATEHANMDAATAWGAVGSWSDAAGGAANLTTEDAVSTPSSDNTAISQQHQLLGADAAATLAVEAPNITQTHALVTDAASATPATDAVQINQAQALSVENAVASPTTDNGAVTQVHALVGENAANTPLADNASITQNHTLTGADSEATPIADGGAVSTVGSHTLVAEDATTTPSIELIQIDQAQALSVENAVASPTTDNGAVTQVHALVGENAANTPLADNASITQNHTLTGADSESTPIADGGAISSTVNHVLVAEDINATPAIDVVNINQQHGLLSSDALQTPEVDGTAVGQTHTLIGDAAQVMPTVDAASLTGSGLGLIKSPSIRRLTPTYQLKFVPNQRSIKTIAA